MATIQHHPPEVGDVVEIAGHSVGDRGRSGEVVAVLGDPGAERLRVRWDDGHESIFSPGSDATIRPPHDGGARGAATTFDLVPELERRRIEFELIHHERTQTAADEAAVLHVPPEEVAKTLVLATDAGFVRAVVPASARLDLPRVRELLGDRTARLATEAELAGAYPMFELGAVPPFGGPEGDRTVVDSRLAGTESVVLEAGTHGVSVWIGTADLLTLADAEVASLHVE
jgi:Ala-tRNA(Pro) deacylase